MKQQFGGDTEPAHEFMMSHFTAVSLLLVELHKSGVVHVVKSREGLLWCPSLGAGACSVLVLCLLRCPLCAHS